MALTTLNKDTEFAWDIVVRSKYAHDVDADVAFLKSGGTSLMSHERSR